MDVFGSLLHGKSFCNLFDKNFEISRLHEFFKLSTFRVHLKESLQITMRHLDSETTALFTSSLSSEIWDQHKSCCHDVNSFITLSHKIVINDSNHWARGISTISPFGKDNIVLQNIKYDQVENQNNELKVTLYITPRYTLSALISMICNDFCSIVSRGDVPKILWNDVSSTQRISMYMFNQINILLLLFKQDSLDVLSEDQVFEAFLSWYDQCTTEDDAYLNDCIRKLSEHIRWRYITLTKLTKGILSRPFLKSNIDLRRIFKEEFKYRITKTNEIDNPFWKSYYKHSNLTKPPRKSYEQFYNDESHESLDTTLGKFTTSLSSLDTFLDLVLNMDAVGEKVQHK